MLRRLLRALSAALLFLEARCLGDRPACSESALYSEVVDDGVNPPELRRWPHLKWDPLYLTKRPLPDLDSCTTIDLEGAELTSVDVQQLVSSITANSTLTQDLTAVSLGSLPVGEAIDSIALYLQSTTTLTHLALGHTSLDATVAAPLFAALKSHPSLERVDLEWNQLADQAPPRPRS